jgi:hypothetical protein
LKGTPEADTGQPDGDSGCVLCAPTDGLLITHTHIAEIIIDLRNAEPSLSTMIRSPLTGLLRCLLHSGLSVQYGQKIVDIVPRDDPRLCQLVSDKSLSIGGRVLEVILSQPIVRSQMWT